MDQFFRQLHEESVPPSFASKHPAIAGLVARCIKVSSPPLAVCFCRSRSSKRSPLLRPSASEILIELGHLNGVFRQNHNRVPGLSNADVCLYVMAFNP